MTDVAEAQTLIRETFTLRAPKVEAGIYDAWRFLKPRVEKRITREYTLRRVRTLHEGTARIIHGAELDALREAQIIEARRERDQLKARLARLDEALARADEEFHGPAMAALRDLAG